MKLYLSVIGIAMAIISAFNIAFKTAAWYYVILATLFCTLLEFAIDGGIAYLIHKLPERSFSADDPRFCVSERELRLYKRLGVRRWKDKIWELGGLGGFSKKSLYAPSDPRYIERFLTECHKGVLTHRLSYPAGFLVMLLLPPPCSFTVALPVALVNLFLNILPTLALRYNTPMLLAVLSRLRAKEQKHRAHTLCAQEDTR